MSLNPACWTLLYLGANKVWKDRAFAEVQNLIAAYTNTVSSEPIHQRLSTIPISTWEDEMPVMESIIRETIRIVINGTALRRSVAGDVQIGDKTIDKGAFMAYNLGDVHLNKMFYPDPLKFDPDRFNVTNGGDTQGNAPFLGWGTGRHPCSGKLFLFFWFPLNSLNFDSGMKVAKLEIKMILVLVLAQYEFKLVDASGDPSKQLPQPNRNDIFQVCSSLQYLYLPNTDPDRHISRPDPLENRASFITGRSRNKRAAEALFQFHM